MKKITVLQNNSRKLLTMLSLGLALTMAACSPTLTPDQMAEMLSNNPEILTKAIEKNPAAFMAAVRKAAEGDKQNSEKAAAQQEAAQLEIAFNNPLQPELDSTRASMGSEKAPITIVEYTDFECPYCARGYTVLEEVRKLYGDKVRVVVKNLPLPMHPMAVPAAKRFEALKLQNPDKAFAFYHDIFTNQQQLQGGEKQLDVIAKKAGADMSKLRKDMDSAKVMDLIRKDVEEARKFDIQGTPGFIVNGVPIKGAYPVEHFKQIIDRHLSSK